VSRQYLQTVQSRWGRQVDAEIERWLGVASNLRHFADMMRYQLEFVDERGRPLTTSSSKRFRPLLCLLACQGAGADPAHAITVAAAIELLHNFSLIHDDIQDRDETRRHRPTVWKLWGEAQGINVGDGMFALASRASVDASDDPVIGLDVARRFQCTTLLLTEGQYLDMSFEQRTDVNAPEYLDMIAKKTGALIEFSLWSGARVAGADDAALEAVGRFGLELGKAFQIYDDIQGVWADTTTTGKEAAKDLVNRKKTLPVLLAAEHTTPAGYNILDRFFRHETNDPAPVQAVLDDTDSYTRTQDELRKHLTIAIAALHDARMRTQQRDELEQLAHELTDQRLVTS